MRENKITDVIKAQAAIAYLISEGWAINIAELNKTLPGGLKGEDWLNIANGCLDHYMNELDKHKVIPISRYLQ